jgi:hypothetical protein
MNIMLFNLSFVFEYKTDLYLSAIFQSTSQQLPQYYVLQQAGVPMASFY